MVSGRLVEPLKSAISLAAKSHDVRNIDGVAPFIFLDQLCERSIRIDFLTECVMSHRQPDKTHAIEDLLLHLYERTLRIALLQQHFADALVPHEIVGAQVSNV
jgi:hypothetical protein